MSKAISILYLLKLHVIAENGADLIDKRLVECHPVTALCLILHIDMLIIDGASHLVFNELGCEIYSLVAGLESILLSQALKYSKSCTDFRYNSTLWV